MKEPTDGFEGIRWIDSIEAVADRFPDRIRQTASYEGRNPRTGERVYIGPGISIDDLPATPIRLTTMVAEWDRFNATAADAIRELARRLRLTDVSMELQEQTWTVDGVEIVLAIDTGPGDFTLTMRRPR